MLGVSPQEWFREPERETETGEGFTLRLLVRILKEGCADPSECRASTNHLPNTVKLLDKLREDPRVGMSSSGVADRTPVPPETPVRTSSTFVPLLPRPTETRTRRTRCRPPEVGEGVGWGGGTYRDLWPVT